MHYELFKNINRIDSEKKKSLKMIGDADKKIPDTCKFIATQDLID